MSLTRKHESLRQQAHASRRLVRALRASHGADDPLVALWEARISKLELQRRLSERLAVQRKKKEAGR